MSEELKKHAVEITEKGSLALLAIGDLGIRAWRDVKKKVQQQRKNEKKE